MNLFLDCEFNGYKGGLISMALVPEDLDAEDWYRVLYVKDYFDNGYDNGIDPWVSRNVIPVLGDSIPVYKDQMRNSLRIYLSKFKDVCIIADWPDDIKYFCDLLIVGPGEMINCKNMNFCLRRDLSSEKSDIPHNALYDARSIRTDYLLKKSNIL